MRPGRSSSGGLALSLKGSVHIKERKSNELEIPAEDAEAGA